MAVLWNGARAKVQLRLASERTRALQAKLEAMQKVDRKALTTLVEKGKLEAARVRTEALINTDVHIELLELLELYTDTLLTRFALLENTLNTTHANGHAASDAPEPALADALAAILYASPQTELRELHQLREVLSTRLPRDWALAAIEGNSEIVPARILSKVRFSARPPDPVLVDAYISEICGAYNVPFTPAHLVADPSPPPPLVQEEEEVEDTAAEQRPAQKNGDANGKPEHLKAKAELKQSTIPSSTQVKPVAPKSNEDDALADLEARFASLKRR